MGPKPPLQFCKQLDHDDHDDHGGHADDGDDDDEDRGESVLEQLQLGKEG